MSFPVIHGISLNASGTSIKVKQPKQKGSKAQPVEKVTYQSSMPEFRWHDQSEFREIIFYVSKNNKASSSFTIISKIYDFPLRYSILETLQAKNKMGLIVQAMKKI